MMDIKQLRAAYDAACVALHEARDKMVAAQRAIDDAGDDADVDALKTEHTAAVEAFDAASEEAERTKANWQAEEKAERTLAEHPAPVREAGRPSQRITVGDEELIYRADLNHAGERSFFADCYRAERQGDWQARERLAKNSRQQADIVRERGIQLRDVGTGAFAGLTVPQYLVDLVAPLARAGSPTLNACRKLPLPEQGLVIDLSRITTGSAVAAQASENSAVQETDMDDTLLQVNVRTYSGQQDVSRQAIERSVMIDELVYADLIADYFTKLDAAILSADGTNGTHLGILNTNGGYTATYTDASPTVPEAYPKFSDAVQGINSNRFLPATTWIMHSRRWGWMTAALDSQSRPLVVPDASGPFNALAVGDAAEYGQVVGTLQSLPVITDANIPTNLGGGTNQDVVVAARIFDAIFFQEGDGMPRQFRFDQVAPPQSVRLAVWGYSAFTAGRYPTAFAQVGGTGFITPAF